MKFAYALFMAMALASYAHAQTPTTSGAPAPAATTDDTGDFDTSNMTEQQLEQLDQDYENATGLSAHLPQGRDNGCSRMTCHIYALVNKTTQTLQLFVDGNLEYTWPVSTARAGYVTPDFDKHPDGRIFDDYTSATFPGGSWHGLGNMPYAVFIQGGFAIHGVPQGEWADLGHPASHGCIRINPNNAFIFNRMVRAAGVENVWVTVEN